MSRRQFLKTSALMGASAAVGGLGLQHARAQRTTPSDTPERLPLIHMGGYGPPTTSFSQGLRHIGDRLNAKFGDEIDVKYVYNVMDVGYRRQDLTWLVDAGVLNLTYYTITDDVPELELAALPFLFSDTTAARAAMDGPLGQAATRTLEAQTGFHVLGFFENGFRHISNRLRPVRTPADLKAMKIRALSSQRRTLELLGADPQIITLDEAIAAVKAGTLDGQENPFANTVTYGIHPFHRYHTATFHSYLSRPIFVRRPSFDAWPEALQIELQAAVREAVTLQRDLHDQEEAAAAATIRDAGGEIVELTPREHQAFVDAVNPIYGEARTRYSREILALVGL